ncbi:GNAT family N-acetyltransferase [Clostridium sp. YIM B02515]|uniref:GNAT family N-acetyltransferase n=1 Tax=Clostridium rhizosphaerae TaxID=2803861 RepID=A0ABS1THA0_9CLOT|nr:GNAT family N-acetyltransferase [Clostridium rhizosphaerae]MBL4938472.1 GNAT family N-acetyltransferase [Clostridium rhizosphaerae]
MIELRRITPEDYDDIVDISKSIWEGSDYLPKLFHKWVNDEGYFLGAVDTEKNKVIGVGKFSILHDNAGWLEGLRTHVDYRGRKIARLLSEKLIEISKDYLQEGKINKIGFATYIDSIESITLMQKLGFKLEKKLYLINKEYDNLDSNLSLCDFKVESWKLTYEEFTNLNYIEKRDGLLDLAFVFQKPTLELYDELIENESFIIINGYKGIIKLKNEPYFAVEGDSFDGINTFMNYCLLKYKNKDLSAPFTTLTEQDKTIITKLKQSGFISWSGWQLDYLYFLYK